MDRGYPPRIPGKDSTGRRAYRSRRRAPGAGKGKPVTRFCTKCGTKISDEKRIRRGSVYCSDGCRREARRENRTLLAQRRCRLCGRTLRHRRTPPEAPAPCAPGHSSQAEQVGSQWRGGSVTTPRMTKQCEDLAFVVGDRVYLKGCSFGEPGRVLRIEDGTVAVLWPNRGPNYIGRHHPDSLRVTRLGGGTESGSKGRSA